MLRWKSSLKPAAAASGDNPGTTNLVGDWSMDETSGTRADSHGSNNLTDNNTVGYATGVISNAASFIRANTESLSSSTQPITGTGARADEFWFKTSSSETMAFASYGTNANGKWWRIRIENGAIWQRVTGGAKEWANTWNDGNWHHLVIQVDANSTIDDVVLYIDGTLQSSSGASSTQALDTGSATFYIGRESSGSAYAFDGDIDEFRHWNRVLTANEITWLYNSGSGRSYSALSGGGSAITLETSAENEGHTGYNSPYNISVNYPAVSTNDIMLAILSTERRTDFDGTPPTGWTKVIETDGDNNFNPTQAVYWKRATGSASGTSETWSSLMNTAQYYYAWVGAYSGCVTSVSPIDASAGSYKGYSTNWSISITTQTDNAMILAVAGSDSNARTFVWSDGTELVDKIYQSTASVSINEKIESTAGATTRAGTISGGQSGTMTAVALRDTAPTPLQTRTVTFTAIDVFTIDSDSGQKIWTDQKLNQANISTGLRLWNGSEASNSGATASGTQWAFGTGAACTTWWENYWMRVKQDPGTGTYSDWINLTDASGDIYTSCQPTYNNIGSVVTNYSGPGTWTTHASGFKYQVEIYSASNRP